MEQLRLFEEDAADVGHFILEEAMRTSNLMKAYRRVKRNGGAPGVDGMTVKELGRFLQLNWPTIREKVLSGNYQPQPVLGRPF